MHCALRSSPCRSGADGRNTLSLTGGDEGAAPIDGARRHYSGTYADDCLALLLGLEDIFHRRRAPGSSAYGDSDARQAIQNLLIGHAEKRRSYRIAVLDCEPEQLPGDMRTSRGRIDTKYGALYYPWVTVANPLARPGRDDIPKEINLPPSGFVSGIYARNDAQRGVYKAPANEVVTGAHCASEVRHQLRAAGVASIRSASTACATLTVAVTGYGARGWHRVTRNGNTFLIVAISTTSKPRSIAVRSGPCSSLTAIACGPTCTSNHFRRNFLYNEWKGGALLGTSTDDAYFVRCDRSTMTQNDLDNGRLICLIGVAIIKPAEFVIFRIGQKTADARS